MGRSFSLYLFVLEKRSQDTRYYADKQQPTTLTLACPDTFTASFPNICVGVSLLCNRRHLIHETRAHADSEGRQLYRQLSDMENLIPQVVCVCVKVSYV